MRGTIELILGCMFSGKTTYLLHRLNKYRIANKKVLLIKYSLDNRYSKDKIVTHDKFSISVDTYCTDKLLDMKLSLDEFDVVGIDEGQFFQGIDSFSEIHALMGKTVIISALDGDYTRKQFPSIVNLIPISDKIKKFNAVCEFCFDIASFTLRKIESKESILIGGKESYSPCCRRCWILKNY
jgi:thymidine kinase